MKKQPRKANVIQQLRSMAVRAIKHPAQGESVGTKTREASADKPQYATRAELNALRSAHVVMLAQLLSCVQSSMYSPGRYYASCDDLAEKQPAAVKREMARLSRDMQAVHTLDIAADRNSRHATWQPGYNPY